MVDKAAEDLKLIKLLKDVCGQPIRKLLQDVIEEIGFSSFTDFLWEGDNQRTLAHLRNRSSSQVHGKSVCKRVLGNKQWMKLFEGRGTKIKQHLKASNGSYKPRNDALENLDTALACRLLSNMSVLRKILERNGKIKNVETVLREIEMVLNVSVLEKIDTNEKRWINIGNTLMLIGGSDIGHNIKTLQNRGYLSTQVYFVIFFYINLNMHMSMNMMIFYIEQVIILFRKF